MWDHKVESWVRSYIVKNIWRLRGFYEIEDLYQEAFLKFRQCRRKYPEAEPKHLMSLFMTAFARHFDGMARTLWRIPTSSYEVIPEGLRKFEPSFMGVEVQEALLLSAAVLQLMKHASWVRKQGKRETTETRMRRLLGIPKDVPIRQMLDDFFAGEPCVSERCRW